MTESILDTIKKLIGNVYDDFDQDLIIHINSVLAIYQRQIGRSPETFLRITGSSETWDQLVSSEENLDDVITYVYLKVKKVFDPPTSSIVLSALDSSIAEYEWRLSIES